MIGTKLAGRYEIVGELGRGGMGIVYRVRDPVLSREVAVKLVPATVLTSETEERFLREAQVVAQMDHPGIVPIYDLGRQDDGSLYFLMPLLKGTTLRELLNRGGLRLGDALEIGIQVADALAYSHERGVVHRDVKPENVMVAMEEGRGLRARVMDFGLAIAATESRITKTGMVVGTVAYVSPEQASARPIDGRADIYALGTVLYECLTGDPPFFGEVQSTFYRIVHEAPASLRSQGADVREELDNLVLWTLEKDPGKRPQKAAELADALRRHRAKLEQEEVARSLAVSAGRTLPQPAALPFVGREKEYAELQRRLNSAVQGECQLVVVSGEPGVGKSRLLEELRALARARGLRVLSGLFQEQDRAFSYQGFCELIQDAFRGGEPEAGSSRPDFSDLAGDLVALFPVLAEIPELRAQAGGDSKMGIAAERRKPEDRIAIFELLARALTRIGASRPLVLLLENLHGAEISIEALAYVVRRLRPTPTLVVGTYRQTETDRRHPLARMLDSFADDPRFLALPLGPLSRAEHRTLVESAVGSKELAEGLAERLYEATEGNPFFTRELVHAMLDSGALTRADTGVVTLSGPTSLGPGALPATIQQAVEKRIERLPESLRELLSVASVLGKSFEARDLSALLAEEGPARSVAVSAATVRAGGGTTFRPGGPGDGAAAPSVPPAESLRDSHALAAERASRELDEGLDELVREGLLEEDRASRGDRLAFVSGIVRDVLYGSLSRRRRRSLHRRSAELLESRHAGRLERIYPQLVHHFSQGDVPEKTVTYGLLLVERQLLAWSPEEATRVAKTTLEYLDDEDWAGDRQLAGEARWLLARAHRMSGDLDGALREMELASKRLTDPARLAKALLFAAETAWQARKVDETRVLVERGLEWARAVGSREELAPMLLLLATVASLRGEQQRAGELYAEAEKLTAAEAETGEELVVGGTLVVGMSTPVLETEPALSQTIEESEVLGNVFETLVTTDARGSLLPNLAESWEVRGGGRTIRLSLRREARFSDGERVTAPAVKVSLERAIRLRPDMPVAGSISGVREFRRGEASDVWGILAVDAQTLEIRLVEPVPIFPALLTDVGTAVVRAVPDADVERVLGTGPFRLREASPSGVVLERNPEARVAPRLDRLEFRTGLTAAALASGLRSGEIELVRDLLPQDLEDLLRDPRLRPQLVEVPRRSTWFVQFKLSGSPTENIFLRRALSGVVRTQDFVWGALGRFALPATGLLPPGVLGHDAGRRRPHLSASRAAELVEASGLSLPIRLRAAVHPLLLDRYRALISALFEIWASLRVEVETIPTTMAEFLNTWKDPRRADLLIGRWLADYDDPDSFLFGLFHSRGGSLSAWYATPGTDQLMEAARTESRPGSRELLYHRFEEILLEEAVLLPLFHEVDHRLAGSRLRRLSLSSAAPFVAYAELGKARAPSGARSCGPRTGGVLHVPLAGKVTDLDPVLALTVEQSEVLPNVFETLTRDVEGARAVPWLASEVEVDPEGTSYRFRLRPGIRFHDGRPLTARDVRWSFERLLADPRSEQRWLLSCIRGARRVLDGETTELAGLRILSPSELVIELERRLAFFPVILSYPVTAIVPEGTAAPGGSFRERSAGTGPFRIVQFEPGKRLELERNPSYWREGYPKGDGLVFHFDVAPEQIRSEFLSGRYSLASDLYPADAEAFRHDPSLAAGYRESPRLSTYFAILNRKAGALADVKVRRRLHATLREIAPTLVGRTIGRLAAPASGLIPPGLLGASPLEGRPGARPEPVPSDAAPVELQTGIHPVFLGEFGSFVMELSRLLRISGFVLKPLNSTMEEFSSLRLGGQPEIFLARWIADFPDADTFVHGLVHSEEGLWGRFVGEPALDELAERGREEPDPSVRHALYRQAEERLQREALVVPFFHEQVYRFARPDVEGLQVGFSRPVVSYEKLWTKR